MVDLELEAEFLDVELRAQPLDLHQLDPVLEIRKNLKCIS
jgi:hypothetical protein